MKIPVILGMVTKAVGSLWVQDQPVIHGEYQDTQGHIESLVSK